jgi:hypothetical protein
MTPDAAREKIATYMEPGSPYWNKSHPNHQKAIDDVLNLREIANDTEG